MQPEASELFRASRLCVVGNINRDVKTAPLEPGDHLFEDGETSVAAVYETVGGGGANSACAAAALGAGVTFVGKVGADPLADRLEQTLKEWGVDARLARTAEHPTGTSLGLTFTTGHRHFLSHLPASRSLRFEDIDLSALDGRRHLLRADVWFSEDMLYGGNARLLRAAHDRGIATSIDLNWDPHWRPGRGDEVRRRKQAVRDVLPWVTLAHGNERELKEFTGAADLAAALALLEEWGARAVVVHMGDRGAGYYERGALVVEPPVPAAEQVNTTGTGDVLSVCMMLLHDRTDLTVQQKLRTANGVVSEFISGRRVLLPEIK